MKYVYAPDKYIDRSLPENVPYRLFFGTLFALVATFFFVFTFFQREIGSAFGSFLVSAILAAISFILTFFAVRTWRAIRRAKSRTPEDIIETEKTKPFYSSQCLHCSTLIDYQRIDLAFRLWFLRGYVECPCCHKPIRHNKKKNTFIPHRYPEESLSQDENDPGML